MRMRDFPIRVSLMLLILFASGLAVLLASAGFAVYEGRSFREAAERESIALADSVGANSAASLAFSDPSTARDMLGALGREPHVVAAVLYDERGKVFAEYVRPDRHAIFVPDVCRPDGSYQTRNSVTLYRGVELAGERVGSIALVFDLSEQRMRLLEYAKIALLVLVLSVAVTLLASLWIANSIGKPLIELAEATRRVTTEEDCFMHADIQAGGETGLLVDSFNKMLARIESREKALRKALESLRESEERYALAARGANDGLWDWNLANHRIYFSPRWNLMLGFSENEHWTDPEDWFGRIHPADVERVRSAITQHCAGFTQEFSSEYRMRHKSGTYIWMLTRGIAVRNPEGQAIRIAGSQTDITEGKIADPLTQIPNRLYFLDRLEAALERAGCNGSAFAVLFIDLDGFKLINDSLGHAAGDELLIDVAGRVRGSLRTGVHRGAGEQSIAARLGGDEFAVLLCPVREMAEAAAVGSRILERLTEPFYFESRRIVVSASIGIAMNTTGNTPEDLLRNADTAMYVAKTCGKARIEFFDEEIREQIVTRFETETDLRKAIDADQLVVYYQPIVSLPEGCIRGFEALVRWNHPERGIIPPAEFIPIAEGSNLIGQIGKLVLRKACRQAADWLRRWHPESAFIMSVNVSSRQLADPGLVEDVEIALRESGLDPGCLALELTESSILGNAHQTLATLHRLKTMGVKLEIDDFGTGYSSLSYLQQLPFDTLKIDCSFVRDVGTKAGSTDIVRAILELARSLQMGVIAEGVETEEQSEKLHGLGADLAQGFLFSGPVEAETAEMLYLLGSTTIAKDRQTV